MRTFILTTLMLVTASTIVAPTTYEEPIVLNVEKPKPIKDKRGIGIAIRGIGKAFTKGN